MSRLLLFILFAIVAAAFMPPRVPFTPSVCAQPPQASISPALPALRKQLHDPKTAVRLEAALTLARQQDVEAIPVLIDLLAEINPAQRKQAEDILRELASDWAPELTLQRDDEISRRIRRDVWAAWWRNTAGEPLLAVFRTRTLTPRDEERIRVLIADLGDRTFAARERAERELVAYGRRALPLLRRADAGDDPERERRLKKCVQLLERTRDEGLPACVIRLVTLRHPPGAVEALLAYLPQAENVFQAQEVKAAIVTLAPKDEKSAPALAAAVTDRSPARRSAAGEALALARRPQDRALVHKLLRDANPEVRLGVALALVEVKDREAVPALIESLADLAPEESFPAQEVLALLAGDKAPPFPAGADANARQKSCDAWRAWWQKSGAAVDLQRLVLDLRPAQTLLSTLKETAFAGHNALGKGLITANPVEPAIEFNGKKYPSGLGTHPLFQGIASTKYELTGKWRAFAAVAAINDSATPPTPLRFTVLGDNRVLWQSEPLQQKGQSQKCQVDITGVRLLELQVHCPGDHSGAHAVWLDPCVSHALARRFKNR
jgi:HEAT repeat protein